MKQAWPHLGIIHHANTFERYQIIFMRGGAYFMEMNFDAFVKSPKTPFSVIPAKAGIQYFQVVAKPLDPVFQRGDGFLRSRQF